jgi:hypothetical protein
LDNFPYKKNLGELPLRKIDKALAALTP